MTFGIAWKDEHFGYVISDAAVTSGQEPRSPESSFGEIQKDHGGQTVQQGALKIFLAGGVLTFAGDAEAGLHVVRMTRSAVERGVGPLTALRQAVADVRASGLGSVEVVGAYDAVSGPRLIRIDTRRGETHDAGTVHHVGSLGPEHVRLTREVIKELVDGARLDPFTMLASVLALLQSYGVHSNIFAEGVGGHFSGAIIGEEVTSWQPDMLFLFYNSASPEMRFRCVSSTIRGDVHIVASSITHDTRCFTNLKAEELATWKTQWMPDLTGGCRNPTPGYAAFIDGGAWRVVLLEMRGGLNHPHLKLEGTAGDEADMTLSPHLQQLLFEPLEPGTQFGYNFLEMPADFSPET